MFRRRIGHYLRNCGLLSAVLATLLLGTGCATNPVTGERQFNVVSEGQELSIGAQQYGPSRQMQGGEYITDPALARYVQSVGARLAQHSDRELPYEFSVLNNSVPNAWALPGGKIALNRGLLLEMETEAELAAVLGHEIIHAAAAHGALGLSRGLLLQGAVIATAVATSDSDYSQYAVGSANIAAQLLNQRYGREAELESDEYGMRYMAKAGYDPQGAVALQKTFVRLSEGRRQDWLSGLFASHPPSQERVDRNIQTASELPSGGEVGRAAYQKATSRIRATRSAYEAYDEGRKALAENKPEEALRLAAKAIAEEPEEGLFYGLQGDVAYARKNYTDAVRHYSEALRRNDAYFKFYLGRGESYRHLNQLEQAEKDLQASTNLLPTADGAAALGLIAEARGQVDEAIGFYSQAAGSNTPAGRASGERLVSLDLPRNPQKYIAVQPRIDSNGRVYAELGNRSGLAVTDVVVVIAYRDANGQVRQEQRVHRGSIANGQTSLVLLGAQPYAGALETLQMGVRSARIAR